MARVIANEFSEASDAEYLKALFAIGFVLLAVTLVVNLFAQLLLRTLGGSRGARQ